jgi:excisionase family DNA binding protein
VKTTELLSTAHAAAVLEVSIPTVNRWVREGRLKPIVKLAGGNVFAPAYIEKVRAERQAKS